MADFTNLTEWARRRDRNHNEVRVRAISDDALAAWEEHAPAGATSEVGGAFVTGFDLGRDSRPTDYARIAVLQTEREVLRRQMDRDGTPRTSDAPTATRYWAIDKQIREALT